MASEPHAGFEVREMRASGVPITIAASLGDLYFQGQLAADDNFEPAVSVGRICLEPDAVVLDVGACLGIVSMAFSKLVPNGRVVAAEANTSAVLGIEATIAVGDVRNVTVVSSAIGAEVGVASYVENPHGAAWGYTSDVGSYEVAQTTIDQIVESLELDRVDLIKIDIEGNELPALLGAEQTIRRHQPVLVVELNPFCLWRFGRTFPQDLVAAMSDRYEYLWAVRPDASVVQLDGAGAIDTILGELGAHGGLVDIVASPRALVLPSPLWVSLDDADRRLDDASREDEPRRRSWRRRWF